MSNKPWELKTDDHRKADTLPTFIIFCEDGVCEPIYFKSFETPFIKINTIPNQKSDLDNVANALTHCREKGIMDEALEMVNSDDIEIWCVFDMDCTQRADIKTEVKFQTSIELAQSKGLKVAWSNDAFELWILMHFQDIDTGEEYKSRTIYYEKLTTIFSELPQKNDRLIRALAHSSFNYKQDLKHENNFRGIVLPELRAKSEEAIRRAEELEERYKRQGISEIVKQSPCTKVHHLVRGLLEAGMSD